VRRSAGGRVRQDLKRRPYGDFAIENLTTEGIFPALLHRDPRYFRRREVTLDLSLPDMRGELPHDLESPARTKRALLIRGGSVRPTRLNPSLWRWNSYQHRAAYRRLGWAARPGMTKCVNQGLFANSVNLILDLSWQLPLAAGHYDAKVDIGRYLEFFLNARQSNNQV
jgi:hypothetical protein